MKLLSLLFVFSVFCISCEQQDITKNLPAPSTDGGTVPPPVMSDSGNRNCRIVGKVVAKVLTLTLSTECGQSASFYYRLLVNGKVTPYSNGLYLNANSLPLANWQFIEITGAEYKTEEVWKAVEITFN